MSFDISRLRRSEQIVAGGAIALFIFLFFFDWYGVSSNLSSIAGINVNISKSGWDVFTNSRWIWLITIIAGLGMVALRAYGKELDLPVKHGVLITALGALSTVLILYRIVHHPTASASYGSFHASAGIKIGIWLGLIAAVAITYGGYLAMHDEGTSLTEVRQQAGAGISNLTTSSSEGTPAAGAPPAAAPPIPPPAAPPGPAPGEGPPSP